jgi:hypothetical protein
MCYQAIRSRLSRGFAMTKFTITGALFIIGGICLILLGIYLEEKFHDIHIDYIYIRLFKLMDHIGVAFISIGLVGFILEFRDWQHYFQKQLATTIMDQHYLDTLDTRSLINLRTRVLKSMFKNENIEGGFLQHFDEKIHGLIGSPYREGVDTCMCIEDYSENPDVFSVKETVSYTCRKMGERVQSEISWGATDDYEVEELKSFNIMIRIPPNFFQSPDFKSQFPNILEQDILIQGTMQDFDRGPDPGDAVGEGIVERMRKSMTRFSNGKGFRLPLNEIDAIDNIYIKISVGYTIRRDSLITWSMTHSSRNVKCTIVHPREYRVQLDGFGMDPAYRDPYINHGTYSLRYNSWLLPGTGIAFHLVRTAEDGMGQAPQPDSATRGPVLAQIDGHKHEAPIVEAAELAEPRAT